MSKGAGAPAGARVTLGELQKEGVSWLQAAGIADAKTDVWLLLESVCGLSRGAFFLRREEAASPEAAAALRALFRRRAAHEPVQYLLHEAWFFGRRFQVTPAVLIPRQDTEVLVEQALQVLRPGSRLLDLCTGSGCVLLTLLLETEGVTGLGADLSKDALAVARENAAAFGLAEPVCRFLQSDLFGAIPEAFDVITANPPYIASAVVETLSREVRDHEPHLALDGGPDGLSLVRRLVQDSRAHLKAGGFLLMEIGYDQGQAAAQLLTQAGFSEVRITRDLSGNDRVAAGRWKGDSHV